MSRDSLGEFEHLVMLAVLHLADEGEVYGVPIVDEIERRTSRSVSRAAVYVALRRLETKGLVESWMSEPTGERGGKSRRCVRVTSAGLQALHESRRTLEQMWTGLEPTFRKTR